ncbi:high frequency lysogenization protein HflD [Aestuariibacter salexigens]|uniref:high frequency lysogenization protein HflD n=1 Tax=Aestuariibacter salexigens TaxID=226010 RepID=UPI001F0A590B|nr:high frequency lysogenization protein HflD [Aestuariibacter salexigens]
MQHIALAGVCQAAALVQQVARTGRCDLNAYQATIDSVTVTDPQQPIDVFGSLDSLQLGFQTLAAQLSNQPQAKDAEVTRYVASILGLERKLARNKKALAMLGERIGHTQRQRQHSSAEDNAQLVASLASIYSDIISPLAPRIQVAGNPANLTQTGNQNKVRALLLAGVRAAVLWRQMGGKRRYILFRRSHILRAASNALQQIN